MPTYEVHIICPACDGEHVHRTKIELSNGPETRRLAKSLYSVQHAPFNLLLVLTQEVFCPKMEKPIRQPKLEKVFLVPQNQVPQGEQKS
jgi:hypothetical protein